MWGRLFGRAPSSPVNEVQAIDTALHRGMGGARLLYPWLLEEAETERGVHVESLLVIVGALSGRACHLAARDAVRRAPLPHWGPWAEASGADGRTFHLGDPINHFLMEGVLSLWEIAASAAAQAGDGLLPEVSSIAGHVAATIGSDAFGVVRFPEDTGADEGPLDYLRLWPRAQALLEVEGLETELWPVAFALTAARVLEVVKEVVPPATALHIFMESAIVTAKIAPD